MADSVINFATDKVLGPIMAALMDYTIKGIGYIRDYQKIGIKLATAVDELKQTKKDFEVTVQTREIEQEEVMTETAQDWFKKVNEMLGNKELKVLLEKAGEIKNNKDDQGCSGCCHGSLDERFKFGKKASEKLEEIEKLRILPPSPYTNKILGDRVKEKLELLRSRKWDTREKLKKDLIAKVLDGQVLHHVGLCGDEGVGKTTLVKEITREKEVKEAFQKRVIVLMGEFPKLKDIQNKIAEGIGAKLNDEDKIELNAVALENHIRTKKENILIILDDLWAKVDLNELGTGRNNEYCKHLIVTRSENVIKLMEIKENKLDMKLMTDEEAIAFFWKVVYDKKSKNRMVDQITSYAYISLAKKLIVNHCGNVPNVVAALANYLANLEIGKWKKLGEELSREKSKEEMKNKILNKNYEHFKTHEEEEQIFSSLGCVFQPETIIPIHEWMRYAIGLDLIKNVDSLSEAMSKADTWIQDMISSSLLEEEDKGFMGGLGHVTIPRQVRDQLKNTSLDGKIELLDDIRRWTDLETISKSKYKAISLWSGRNHGRISGKEFIKLEVLILDGSYPEDEFEDDFFYGMTNLKVLVLKKMKFKKQLPKSLGSLKDKLSLLHLEECELREDISLIGELVNLVVLSFRESKMKKFPANEIRRLSKLRVLDLYKCTIDSNGIPANVLKTLAKLEGFYCYGIDRTDWADLTQETNRDWKDFKFVLNRKDKNASLDELNELDQLNVLEIEVPHLHQLPKNEKFVNKLQHFYIFVGKKNVEFDQISAKGFSRIMMFGYLESELKANEYECLQTLLAKTDLLSLEGMKNTQFFVQQKETKPNTPEIDVAEYTNLKVLKMNGCEGMRGFAAKPLKAPNLNEIEVIKCNILNFLFIEHTKDSRHEYNSLPLLKKLVLKKLGKLGCISSPDIIGNEAFAALFDGKVICPLLETLELVKCGQIMQIWSKSNLETSLWKRFKPSLKNLKDVSIKDCQKLQHVCSLTIAAVLVNLKKLEISSCSLLKTVIKSDTDDYLDFTHNNDNNQIFPALEELTLAECNNVKTFLSHKNSLGNQTFILPSLGKLRIQECPNMKSFSSIEFEIKTPKLWWLTVEPCTHPKKEIENIDEFLKKQNQEPRKSNEESSETDDVAPIDLGKKSVGCANFTCFGNKLKEPNKKKRK